MEKSDLPPPMVQPGFQVQQTMPDAPPPYSAEAPIGFKQPDPMYPPVPQPDPMVQQPMIQPIMQQPVVVVQGAPAVAALGPDSLRLNCPHCQADMNTRVDKDPSIAAYVTAGLLFVFGCVCGCCLIPFCMDSCKTSEHYCANCKRFIGRYSKY